MLRQIGLATDDLDKLHETLQPIHDAYEAAKAKTTDEMELDDLRYKYQADLAEASFEYGLRFALRLYANHFYPTDMLILRLSDDAGVNALIGRMLERR